MHVALVPRASCVLAITLARLADKSPRADLSSIPSVGVQPRPPRRGPVAADKLARECIVAKMAGAPQTSISDCALQPEGAYRPRALLERQPVALRALIKGRVSLVDSAIDVALLQRERERETANAASHNGNGGSIHGGVHDIVGVDATCRRSVSVVG